MLRLPFYLSLLLLAACMAPATPWDSSSRAYVRLDGARLQLKTPLAVAAGKARIFIQDGEAPPEGRPYIGGGFDQYRPHCAFEIDSVDHEGVVIEPDTFDVTRVQDSLQQVVRNDSAPLRVAALDSAALWGVFGSSAYHLGYHFYLHSSRQPDVMRMSCYGAYAEPYDLYPPTLGEIRHALGNLADIHR